MRGNSDTGRMTYSMTVKYQDFRHSRQQGKGFFNERTFPEGKQAGQVGEGDIFLCR